MDEGDVDLLARLKGPALAIFVAVGRGAGLPSDELQTTTGWGRGVTYEALRRLAAAGWIIRDRLGGWWLTPAGHVAMGELLNGREPRAGSVSRNGTAIHRQGTAVPEYDTETHRQGTAGPEYDTAIHGRGTAVPECDTETHRRGTAVPEYDTGGGRPVSPNDTAQSRGVSGNGTGPHHDHDHDDDQEDDDLNPQIIVRALKAMDFKRPEAWLATVDRRLVMPWVRYLEQNPGKHPSPAGYLRRCVQHGDLPGQGRARRRARDPCPECGRSFWTEDGDCLVCAGVIKC